MVSKRRQKRILTYNELAHMADEVSPRGKDAWSALERYRELRKAGKNPTIYYSEFDGFFVREPFDHLTRPD